VSDAVVRVSAEFRLYPHAAWGGVRVVAGYTEEVREVALYQDFEAWYAGG